MIVRESLDKIVEELFSDVKVNDFSINWILNSPRASENSVREVYTFLRNRGLSDDKIASQAQLLGMNPETIERNYQNHIGLLRENYQDRASGRGLILNQPQLLGISPETINANVQFLSYLGIDYNNYTNALLLGTEPQTKRRKMAWMLRELFNYGNLPQEQKREAINGLYRFVRDNPRVLIRSINSMGKSRKKLRERILQYK